jgi:hypothetical protein
LYKSLCLGDPNAAVAVHRLDERHSPKLLPCAFVQFSSALEAQIALRTRHHDKLMKVTPRCIDTPVREIIWNNLGLRWWQVLARRILAQLVSVSLIVFWSFPVALVTAMTNVDAILPSLHWQEKVPEVTQNALRGLVPSLLLSLLMALPPRIITRLGRFSGLVTLAGIENYVQNYYFCFRIVQIFLVAALGSTASSMIVQIYKDPSSTATILAKRLPGASNFYFSYLIVQGFSESAFVLLNVGGLFSRYLLARMLDDTPRKKTRRRRGSFEISSGTVFAICSSLVVIALCYAPVAPLMLCFAALALFMFYLAYRHNLLRTADVVADTGGEIGHCGTRWSESTWESCS